MSLHKSVTISYTVLNARYLIILDILTILCQTYNDEFPVVHFLPFFCYLGPNIFPACLDFLYEHLVQYSILLNFRFPRHNIIH